jgi:hypothetical protein
MVEYCALEMEVMKVKFFTRINVGTCFHSGESGEGCLNVSCQLAGQRRRSRKRRGGAVFVAQQLGGQSR